MFWNKKIKHKQSKYFTIMLIPDSSVKVKSIKIPHWFFYITGVLVVLVISGVVLSRTQVLHFKEMFLMSRIELQESVKKNNALLGQQTKLKSSFQKEKQRLEEEKESVEESVEEKIGNFEKK